MAQTLSEQILSHAAGHTVDLQDDLSFEALDRGYLKRVDPETNPQADGID